MLRTVTATRYVTPLREGGSLPAIVEADDLGLYVAKFRGAGQGVLVLTAEIICSELARIAGLSVPEVVFIEVDAALGRNEPDFEIRELLQKSIGRNLATDYLPGSVMFDPAAKDVADDEIASAAVWFDAFVMNVDRTARNPNLLRWHKELYFIDHGAALYFHHNWPAAQDSWEAAASSSFRAISQHVLLPWATRIEEAGERIRPLLTRSVLDEAVRLVPDEWLSAEGTAISDPAGARSKYADFLEMRAQRFSTWQEEAVRARAQLV